MVVLTSMKNRIILKMGTSFLLLVVISLASFQSISCQKQDALVDTGNLGKIQGTYQWLTEENGAVRGKYIWFTGIPYADPGSYTGDNRFKPSKVWEGSLPDEGNGTFYADESKAIVMCPQRALVDTSASAVKASNVTGDGSVFSDPFNLIKTYYSREGVEKRKADVNEDSVWGREDCLILSISTPKVPRGGEALLPVLVFIHGGGFDQFWGNIFGGQRLLNHDMIVVSINYRLGILGSLNLGIVDAPGNAALYDCITALEWIQKHIHHFGGDPKRVTVSGQSAGAVMATGVFVSPLVKEKALISGAIGASGSVSSVWANNDDPIPEHLKFISFSPTCKDTIPSDGLPTDEEAKEIRDCMRRLTLKELINTRARYNSAESSQARLGYDALVPSVQRESLKDVLGTLALPATPAEIIKNKWQNDVPLMMGATRHDGSFVMVSTFYDYLVNKGLDSDAAFIKNELIPTFLKGVGIEDTTGALLHSLQKSYMGNAANSDDSLSKLPGVLDIHTAVGFNAGGYGLVEGHSKLNPNAYWYAFNYQGAFTTFELGSGTSLIKGGVAHVDDLLYLFQLIPLLEARDMQVANQWTTIWANFVIHGNPNGPGEIDAPFPKYNPVDHRFLIVNDTIQMGFHCRDTWYDNSLELNWIKN